MSSTHMQTYTYQGPHRGRIKPTVPGSAIKDALYLLGFTIRGQNVIHFGLVYATSFLTFRLYTARGTFCWDYKTQKSEDFVTPKYMKLLYRFPTPVSQDFDKIIEVSFEYICEVERHCKAIGYCWSKPGDSKYYEDMDRLHRDKGKKWTVDVLQQMESHRKPGVNFKITFSNPTTELLNEFSDIIDKNLKEPKCTIAKDYAKDYQHHYPKVFN